MLTVPALLVPPDRPGSQIKATGVMNSETQAAITKFERERKLPITGQMSDRLLRELAVLSGRPIE